MKLNMTLKIIIGVSFVVTFSLLLITSFPNNQLTEESDIDIDIDIKISNLESQINKLRHDNNNLNEIIASTRDEKNKILDKFNLIISKKKQDKKQNSKYKENETKNLNNNIHSNENFNADNISESEEYIATMRYRQELHKQEINDRLISEEDDPEWREKVSNTISIILNDEKILGTEVVNSQCTSSLCKYEFKHISSSSAYNFNKNFTDMLDWQGEFESYSATLANGIYETKLYLMKENSVDDNGISGDENL